MRRYHPVKNQHLARRTRITPHNNKKPTDEISIRGFCHIRSVAAASAAVVSAYRAKASVVVSAVAEAVTAIVNERYDHYSDENDAEP